MALQERTKIDRVNHLLDLGTMEIRERIEIYDNVTGEVRSSHYHRRPIKEADRPAELAAVVANVDAVRVAENNTLKTDKTKLEIFRQAYDKWATDQALTPPTNSELRAIAVAEGWL